MAKNTSDSIEEYIKQLLAQSGIAEIKRSNLADTFQVVPSQINYVIKTRFTESRGYTVESKRGGGGYIRIARVRFSDQHQMFGNLMANIGERISEQVFTDLIQLLFDEKIITEREGNLILATLKTSCIFIEYSLINGILFYLIFVKFSATYVP